MALMVGTDGLVLELRVKGTKGLWNAGCRGVVG